LTGYVFDYYLKDQLGNTRMTITDDNATWPLIIDATSYYPFGLTMSGISFKAAGTLQNKFKFNDGTELQSGEFSDGSGLEIYETRYRSLDPQLGRFWQVDPLANLSYEFSPFLYGNNNPILINDPSGLVGDSTDKKGNVWHGLDDVVVKSSKKQPLPLAQIFVWSKAGGKDVGHTALRIGDVIYGFYPTSSDPNANGYGIKDLAFPGSPGKMHVDSLSNFNNLYAGQEVTYYQLNLTPEQMKKLNAILQEIAKNPGSYNLFHNQCTSVAINSLLGAGVKIYGQRNEFLGPAEMGNGNLVSPSNLQSILQSPYNKALVSKIVKFVVGQ